MVLKLIVCITIIVFQNFASYEGAFEGYEVYEVPLIAAKISEENFIKSLNYPSEEDIEIIQYNPFKGSVQVLVSPSKKKEFLATLKSKKLKSKVIIQDVGRLIEPSYQLRSEDVDLKGESTFEDYMSFKQINDFVELVSERFPHKIRLEYIGSSIEGENIPMVVITEQIRNMENKPIIFLEAGTHAREWVGISTAVYFIDKLAGTPTYTRDVEWRIIPVVNPDGYKFTFANISNRLWRKNRRMFPDSDCVGVDLNRNFDFHWGTAGTEPDKCVNVYPGEAPFSEPESKAIRDAILEIQNRTKVFVSLHSFGQFIFHPPGMSSVKISEERKEKLRDLGNQMAQVIYKETFKRYFVGAPATLLYEASGSSMDWAMFKAGIPLAFTFELRDEGQDGFFLPEAEILPTAEEIWAAVNVLYNESKKFEMPGELNGDAEHLGTSKDGLHTETNDANEISIPFSFIQSALTNLLNDSLSYLWNKDFTKLFDNFFIGNDIDEMSGGVDTTPVPR